MNPIRTITLVLLLLATGAQAQQLSTKFTIVAVNLDGAICTFRKGDSCIVTAPDGYNAGLVWITGRAGTDSARKIFKINVQTPGLTRIEVGAVRPYDSAYVRSYKYRFPVTMQIMDGAGTLLKTLTVIPESIEFTSLVDSSFLYGMGWSKRTWNFDPFIIESNCESWTKENDASIKKRLANAAWVEAAERIRWILNEGYGCTMYTRNGYKIYSIKSPTPEQMELQDLCKRMKKTVNNWHPLTITLDGERQVKLGKMADEFVTASQKPGLTDTLRFLCLYNASVCSFLSGQGAKAVDLYNEYIKLDKQAGVPILIGAVPDNAAWEKYSWRHLLLHPGSEMIDIPYLTD